LNGLIHPKKILSVQNISICLTQNLVTMKKRSPLVVGLFCLSFSLLGQSTLKFVNPNPGVVDFDNLWMVRYESNLTIGSEAQMQLQLRKNGQLVYQALTNPIAVTSDMQLVQSNRVGFTSEAFIDEQLQSFVQASGALPSGTYTACVSELVSKKVMANACIEFSVVERSQLRLLYVPDGKMLKSEEQPMFSWSFLSSSIKSADITYRFVLCEVLDGQSEQDAIMRNVPILSQKDLISPTLQYPVDAQELKSDKKYAWAVEASLGEMVVAKSEVWDFTVATEEIAESLEPNAPYLDLDHYSEADELNVTGSLFNLRFEHFANKNVEVSFEIVDEQGRVLKSSLGEFETQYGVNYINLDLSKVKKLRNKKSYVLVIRKGDDEFTKVNFTYLKN